MKRGSRSAPDDSFTEFVVDQLAGLGTVEARRLFGGRGLYWKDQIFGLIHRGRLFLRASEAGSVRLAALGSRPFEPKPGHVMKGYWEIPATVLEDGDEVVAWAREGWALPRSKAKAARVGGRIGSGQEDSGKPRPSVKRPRLR